MKKNTVGTVFVCALVVSSSAQAQTGGQIEGFGGTTFATSSAAPTFGGSIAVPLGDNLQLLGEGGRLTDLKASLLDTALDLTPLDVGMTAWYAEGGLRVIGSRHSLFRPYVEATAGVARLRPSVALDGWAGAITNAGLAFLSQTEPLVGAGGGVIVQSGPLLVDVGYRYKKIFAGDGLASAFSLGSDGFDVNQVRFGVGLRF
jgi:opacity protein-like surface antigen